MINKRHHQIEKCLNKFATSNNFGLPRSEISTFYVSQDTGWAAQGGDSAWSIEERKEQNWLYQVAKELKFAKQAQNERWQDRISALEVDSEEQRLKLQNELDIASESTVSLKCICRDLQQQLLDNNLQLPVTLLCR